MSEPFTDVRRTIGSRYDLLSLIATGGMGQVWRSHDTLLDRPVALKVLRSEFTGDDTFVARFRAEARHTAVLAHRNIATLYDYGEAPVGVAGSEDVAYLVMELVEGESLSDLLARERRLDVARTLEILRQTAGALAAAHDAGVVHRDVKPGNVLVGIDGVVKIADFGIAWSASSVPLTQTGQVVGTAHYLSPEQAAGSKAGPASDVYALGMIGYECLAGRRAFEGENSVQIALMQLRDTPDPLPDDVPSNVRTLIDRALLKDPAARFRDGAALRDAVDDVLAGRMLAAAPADTKTFGTVPFLPAAPGGRRRGRRVLVPLAALLAGAGITLAGLEALGSTAPPSAAAVAEPARVVLVAEDYVGRPIADVEAALGALGLQVERVAQETTAVAPGLVSAISPAGAVGQGDLITVAYAVAPPPTSDVGGSSTGATDVAGVAAPEVAVPAPVVVEVPAATNGNGNGHGHADDHGKGNGHGRGRGQ
ncbi:MAG TPA: protein kinase [Blastococcus sp.]